MRWIAFSLLVLAAVAFVIGWRATSHHKPRDCGPNSIYCSRP